MSVIYAIEPDAPPGTPETRHAADEYAVGKYGDTFNDNTSRLLKAGTRLRFDMHYFAIGTEADATRRPSRSSSIRRALRRNMRCGRLRSGTCRTTSWRFRRTRSSGPTAISG